MNGCGLVAMLALAVPGAEPLPEGAIARFGSTRWRAEHEIRRLAYSADGRFLAVANGGDSLTVFGPGGEWVGGWRVAGRYHFGICLSPDGKRIASATLGTCVAYTAATGEELWSAPVDGSREYNEVVFSRDGKLVVTVGEFGPFAFDATTGKPTVTFARGDKLADPWFAVSDDGRLVAAPVVGGKVYVWDVRTGKRVRVYDGLGDDRVRALAFRPDGSELVALASRSLRVWPLAEQEERWRMAGSDAWPSAVRWSPDGRELVVHFPERGERSRHDAATGRVLAAERVRRSADRLAFAVSPDGRTLAEPAPGNRVRRYDLDAGRELDSGDGTGPLTGLAVTDDGTATVLDTAGRLRRWDVRAGRELLRHTPDESAAEGTLSADGRTATIRTRLGEMLVDVETGEMVRILNESHRHHGVLALSADGTRVLLSDGESIEIQDAEGSRITPRTVAADPPGLGGIPVQTAAFAPDGRTVAIGEPGGVALVETATGQTRRQLRFVGATVLAFSLDSSLLAAGDSRGITVWRVHGRPRPLWHFTGVTGTALAFSPDGKRLAAAGRDPDDHDRTVVSLFDVETGDRLAFVSNTGGVARCVAWTPDGKLFVTASDDGTALTWDAAEMTRRTAARAKEPGPDDLWAALADADAEKAADAADRIAARPDAVSLLADRLTPLLPATAERVDALLKGLSAARFADRQKAARDLEALGERALPAVRRRVAASPDAQERQALEALAARLSGPELPASALREVRAVEVLETLGTPEARRVLERLAADDPAARRTREARDALARWRR